MAFTIEERDTAQAPAIQSVMYDVDLDALMRGFQGIGVLTGCAVTAQGSPDMTVAVAAGTIQAAFLGAPVTVSAGNVTVGAADSTNPRLDLITASAAGVKTITAGTAAAVPGAPALPSGHIYLAMIYVPAAATTITTARITDKRVIIPGRPPGTELDYAEHTSDIAPTETTEDTARVVVTGNAVTYDGGKIKVHYHTNNARAGTTNADTMQIYLYMDGASIGQIGQLTSTGSQSQPLDIEVELTPAAGSHTFGIRAAVSAHTGLLKGGTSGGGHGALFAAFMRIVKA